MSTPVATSEIISQLVRERWMRSFCLPNYAPAGWWECDVFEVTDAGYWHEFEVKVSRADFLADARKTKWGPWVSQKDRRESVSKHELLAQRVTTGPSRFTFVTPAGLIPIEDVPEWAGLIEASRLKNGYSLYLKTVRPAPRLHSEKFGDRLLAARVTSYYRFHRATVRYGVTEVCNGEGI